MSYNNRLKLLGLDRLELRRLRADLVTCYKIINGFLDIPFDSFFRLADYRSTRGHSFMVALCNRETIYIFMLWFVTVARVSLQR